jgi:hypothetical protein
VENRDPIAQAVRIRAGGREATTLGINVAAKILVT